MRNADCGLRNSNTGHSKGRGRWGNADFGRTTRSRGTVRDQDKSRKKKKPEKRFSQALIIYCSVRSKKYRQLVRRCHEPFLVLEKHVALVGIKLLDYTLAKGIVVDNIAHTIL